MIDRPIIHALYTVLIVLFLSACASTQEVADQPTTLEDVLYQKARTAYQRGNYKTAASLFEPLAQKGHADAQYSLGYMHYHGKGTSKDLQKAIHWFTLSAKQGNISAITAMNTIEVAFKKQENTSTTTDTAKDIETYPAPQTQNGLMHDLRQAQPSPVKPTKPAAQAPAAVLPHTQTTPPAVTAPQAQVKIIEPQPRFVTPETASSETPQSKHTGMDREHRKWILQQPSSYFTIQLASSSSRNHTLNFVRDVALDGVYYYRETRNNFTRYYVVHGSFATYSQARRKLRLLNKRGYKDAWIRDIKGIKNSLRESH